MINIKILSLLKIVDVLCKAEKYSTTVSKQIDRKKSLSA